MAAELITPTDTLTGIPLPIAPDAELPSNNPKVADWHHAYHPASHPLLQTLGGKALRNSKLQLVNRNYHNHSQSSYHRFYNGPELTDDTNEQFRLCVLAAAGYVPDQGIDLSSGEPQVITMNQRQRQQLMAIDPQQSREHREIKHRYDPIRDFFSAYAISQDLSHISQKLIEEFISTGKLDRQRYLGHLLISKAAEVAGAAVADDYTAVRRAGKLHPATPRRSSAFVWHTLGRPSRRERLFPELKNRLMLAAA